MRYILLATTILATASTANAAPISYDELSFSSRLSGRLISPAIGSTGLAHSVRGDATGTTVIDGFIVHHGLYFGEADLDIDIEADPIVARDIVNNEIATREWTFGISVDDTVRWSQSAFGGELDLHHTALRIGDDWELPKVVVSEFAVDWWLEGPETRVEGTEVLSIDRSWFGPFYTLPTNDGYYLTIWDSVSDDMLVFDGVLDGEPMRLSIDASVRAIPIVPEPNSLGLLLIGLLFVWRRSR